MSSNLEVLELSVFGESHGRAIGFTLEGLPEGKKVSEAAVQAFVDRRKSRGGYATARRESDEVEFLSGLKNGYTTGAPVCAVILNSDARSADYNKLKDTPRPSHCDYAAMQKYGEWCDLAGSGHFSGRLTAPLCAAGGVAAEILKDSGIRAAAYIAELGGIPLSSYRNGVPSLADVVEAHNSELPILCEEKREESIRLLDEARAEGDSLGGVVELVAYHVPAGLGGPLYEGLEGRLASMFFAIPAVKGVEFGDGFHISALKGSEANDGFRYEDGKVVTATNRSGGINGGISNGMEITARIAFRPTPSIAKPQKTVNLISCTDTEIRIKGRHDSCIVPRAVVCTEAAASLIILDAMMENASRRI